MFWLISSALNTLSIQTPGGDVKFVKVGEIFQLQNNKLLVKEFFGFLTSPSTARLYRGRVPRLMSDSFTCCHTRDRVGRPWLLSQPVIIIILTATQPLASGRPQRISNIRPPHQESRPLIRSKRALISPLMVGWAYTKSSSNRSSKYKRESEVGMRIGWT